MKSIRKYEKFCENKDKNGERKNSENYAKRFSTYAKGKEGNKCDVRFQ